MTIARLIKSPDEVLKHDLGPAVSLVGSVEVETRADAPGDQGVAVTTAITNGRAQMEVSAGDNGEIYQVTALLERADGSQSEVITEITVIDGSWVMPDGGVAMLSVNDFVARFTIEEVLRIADTGDGRIDQGLIISALRDAQAMVEASLVQRYVLPFDTVPALVETMIADIARARMQLGEPPEQVATKERQAYKLLERICDGKISLGAGVREDGSSGDPVLYTPGRRVYGDNLSDYGDGLNRYSSGFSSDVSVSSDRPSSDRRHRS